MAKRSFRIGMALVIALAIGLLPIAGGAVFANKAAEMSSQSMNDCCPHASPCDKVPAKIPADACTSMAACALTCFSYSPTVISAPEYTPAPAAVVPLLESKAARSQIASPPFRPPRS